MDILILDSGLRKAHPALKNALVTGYSLSYEDGKLTKNDDFEDEIGHGTGVCQIIQKSCPSANIKMVKIYGGQLEISEEAFTAILLYLYENEKADIINLSLGINACENYGGMYDICKKMVSNGTKLVSAFDNSGAISYPAAFDCVIGVDSAAYINNDRTYEFVESSVVNMRVKGGISRIAWVKPDYIMVNGLSFACAYATGIIANQLIEGKYDLVTNASYINKTCYTLKEPLSNIPFEINNAALFPFNKEMHSLVRFADMLDFNIASVCDVRLSGRVNMSVRKILDVKAPDIMIQDVTSLPWEKIDTLILGHTDELISLTKNNRLRDDLLEIAKSRHVNVYSFDPLDNENYPNIYYPCITQNNMPFNLGKLRYIPTPVLGVFGTSSRQGKFTLQLLLRKKLKERGYRVGQLGSEPGSPLYGMDEVFPFGYNGTVYVHDQDAITVLNEQMWRISQKEYEIIIVGSQSGTIPYAHSNISQYPIKQAAFLYGTRPDAVVLAVNPHDDIEYIQRTVIFIESAINCKVIALSLFPMGLNDNYAGLMGAKRRMSDDELDVIKTTINEKLGVPVYILGDKNGIDSLIDTVIDFF